MADITMCEGRDCPLKEKCFRFKANPAKMCQTYFSEAPYKDGECDYFWPIEKMTKSQIEYNNDGD